MLWAPEPARVAETRIQQFAGFAAQAGAPAGLDMSSDYALLHRWSIDEPQRFWGAVWRFTGVMSDAGREPQDDRVCTAATTERPSTWPEHGFGPEHRPAWFPELRLNFAENLLQAAADEIALIEWNEEGRQGELTFGELRREVAAFAGALRALGIEPGDRVAAVLPNGRHAIIAALGSAAVGAVWSSCSPEFGTAAVVDRFGQIEPRVLVLVDGVRYAGKQIDLNDRGLEIARALESLDAVVHVPSTHAPASWAAPTSAPGGEQRGGARHHAWQEFLASAAPATPSVSPEPIFAQLPFDHPLAILYSSGTTGLPKAIVHSAGGTLLQHRKEHVLHADLRPGDRFFYFTTCGWMMWNWLLSGLAEGAALVLYDGSPVARPDILWQMAAAEGVTHFGASARYFAQLEADGIEPAADHDLSALRCVLSTGSPLSPASFRWIYRSVGAELHLASISGGTDIVSCFVLGNPAGAVREGELQVPGLGMAVEIHAPGGDGIRQPPGVAGELVCTRPFPSMPLYFWGDAEGERFRSAYFERSPGVWSHGDWAEQRSSGGFVIHGRSDATLNPGGVRVGTAEIYRPLDPIAEVREAVAVALERPGGSGAGDVHIVLLVCLAEGVELDAALEQRIRGAIRAQASPRHVPARIVAVSDLPRTLSGKLSELAVRDVLAGREVTQRDALANPASLDELGRLVRVRLADPLLALTQGMIDYAGLFPPARLDMQAAVDEYRRRALSAESGFLSRFVVPVGRLDEWLDAVAAATDRAGQGGSVVRDSITWRLSVIVADDLEAAAARLARLHEEHGTWVRAESLELRATSPEQVAEIARVFDPDAGWELWIEAPIGDPEVLGPLLDALVRVGAGAKVRTGGVTADAFPDPDALTHFMAACVTRDLIFKATAGLHHPLRGEYRVTYEPGAEHVTMFGYLNLLLATAILRHGGTVDDAQAALVERDASRLTFDAGGLRWRDFAFDTDYLGDLRRHGLASFGSCSFSEPVDEIGALFT